MKSLEIYRSQKIQTLQKTIVKSFKTIEEIIGADEQGKKVQGQDIQCTNVQRKYIQHCQ